MPRPRALGAHQGGARIIAMSIRDMPYKTQRCKPNLTLASFSPASGGAGRAADGGGQGFAGHRPAEVAGCPSRVVEWLADVAPRAETKHSNDCRAVLLHLFAHVG